MSLSRKLVNPVMVALVLAIPAHSILLMSDSAKYRFWVFVQMALLTLLVLCLWLTKKTESRHRLGTVVIFALLASAAIAINAIKLNYGHGLYIWWLPLVGLALLILALLNTLGTRPR